MSTLTRHIGQLLLATGQMKPDGIASHGPRHAAGTPHAPPPTPPAATTPTVAIIVPCHNYGRYLAECLQSVLSQTHRPNEILVVDDASTDDTAAVARRFQGLGVRYLHVAHRDVRLTRRAGLLHTTSDVACFVDADDILPPDYIAAGIGHFGSYDVGLVYTDLQFFGGRDNKTVMPASLTADGIAAENYIHAAALVRREALVMSAAMDIEVDTDRVHEDWSAWWTVMEQGWRAVKSSAVYQCRVHGDSSIETKRARGATYYDLAGLAHETITIAVPLCGRRAAWSELSHFLERQAWPHGQCRLLLLDTSQDEAFGRDVRHWLASSDYADMRYVTLPVAAKGLADADRHLSVTGDAVRLAMGRIYNYIGRRVEGRYVLVIEDDVIPCDGDVVERLLRGFNERTISVAAPYRSRFYDGFVAWRGERNILSERGTAEYEAVSGNGFGCTMFRGELLRSAVFTAMQEPHKDFDPAFYSRLPAGKQAKICWSVECRHLGDGRGPVMRAENWPDDWRVTDLSEYRASFLSGREACQWIADGFNGRDPFTFISLGDGEIAWWQQDRLAAMRGVSRHWLRELATSTGLHESDREALLPLFHEALHHATHWPVQFNWPEAERLTYHAMRGAGVKVASSGFGFQGRPKMKVDCNAVYKLPEHGLFWPMLAGKKLAVVGGQAKQLAAALRANGCDVRAIITTPRTEQPKAAAWAAIVNRMEQAGDWSHLVCAAGGLSVLIGERARQMGRRAIDIGQLAGRLIGG